MPLSLTLRPSRGLPGEFTFSTDFDALMAMLRQGTSLPRATLKQFRDDLRAFKMARLLAVEVNDEVLTEIGYFVD